MEPSPRHPDEPTSPALPRSAAARRARRQLQAAPFALQALLAFAILYTVYIARELLLPIALAAFFAVILAPIARWARRRLHIPLHVGAGLILAVIIAAIATAFVLLSAPTARWLEQFPGLLRELQWELRTMNSPLDDVQEASEEIKKLTAVGGREGDDVVEVRVARPSLADLAVGRTTRIAVLLALTLALLYFLLASGHVFIRNLVAIVRARGGRDVAIGVIERIQTEISAYMLTTAAINAALGVAIGIAMWLLGLPNGVLWGIMAAVLNFVPYLGAIIGSIIVALVASTVHDKASFALLAAGVYWSLSAIEGSFVTPLILGRRMTLNPAVLFVGILFWGWVWGVPGVLLATPLLVALKITFDATPELRPIGALMGR